MLKETKEKEYGVKRGLAVGDQKDLSKYTKSSLPKIKPKKTRRGR